MADRAALDAAVDRYYDAWSRGDGTAFVGLFTEGGTFADPPDDETPPLQGSVALTEHFDSVQGMFDRLSYDRHLLWRAGHTIAVHCTVTGHGPDGDTRLPLVHVFRFDADARVRHLDAFIDHDLAEEA